MTELRRDPLTHRWIIIAPERGHRPGLMQRRVDPHIGEGQCPFCPGHEGETPPEIWRLEDERGNWQIRVVPNKFAVLNHGAQHSVSRADEGFISETWTGRHEIVIESPRHDADLSTADAVAVRNVLHAYRERERALTVEGWPYVVIFRNRGLRAGASLDHPHSQIVATPIVPPDVRRRIDIAASHLHETGGPLYRDVLNWELHDGRRVVLDHERFVAFHPFASAAPFETWIMPRVQRSAFGELGDDELDGFATVLRAVLAGLNQVLGNFPYNFIIESCPSRAGDSSHHMSWHLRLVPRLTIRAGFELASGIDVNPVSPEDSAVRLRSAVVRHLFDH